MVTPQRNYIVQDPRICLEFNSLEFARKHVELFGGSIWRRADVIGYEDRSVSLKAGAKPVG